MYKRQHIDRVFDAAYYAEHNEDLYETFGNDAERLLEHFLTAGMKEGRVACETFNVTVYKENNEDLAQIFGDDWTCLLYTSRSAEEIRRHFCRR